MSNFSTVYDQLISLIPTLSGFTTKTKIINPYELESNDDNLLRDGWGLIVGDSFEGELDVFNKTNVNQSFGVVLTRELNQTYHNATPYETVTKLLIEDAVTLRVRFLNADQLGVQNNLELVRYVGRTGISFISDELKILTTTVNFNFSITENI